MPLACIGFFGGNILDTFPCETNCGLMERRKTNLLIVFSTHAHTSSYVVNTPVPLSYVK